MKSIAQTYIEPVFDRTDVPSLHINKIEVTKDTTFVHCTYIAKAGSWARISRNTYLYNPDTQEKFPLLQSRGMPFSPQKREFPDGGTYQILFSFLSIGDATKLDFIEDPDDEAFNIYGIDVFKSFDRTYNYEDIQLYRDSAVIREQNKELESAIEYTQKQLDASNYWYGIRSAYSSYAMFNFTLDYYDMNNWDKMIEWGKNAIDILRDFPQDSLNLDVLVRAYTSVGTAYLRKKQIETGLHYFEESLSFRRMNKRMGAFSYEELAFS
jgi:tetratricopeptide (TPR) repeat protein